MKKLLLLFLVLPLVFSSCSSDDDTPPSLNSSLWETTLDGVKTTITFSRSECILVLSSGTALQSVEYTYTYTHPEVIMYPKESAKAILEGKVSSDYKTIVLVNTSTEKTIGTLSKK